MVELEERVRKLERKLRDGIITIVILGLALGLFTTYTWQSIPEKVTAALDDDIIKKVKKIRLKIMKQKRVIPPERLISNINV